MKFPLIINRGYLSVIKKQGGGSIFHFVKHLKDIVTLSDKKKSPLIKHDLPHS